MASVSSDTEPSAEHGLPEVAHAVAIIMDGNGRWASAHGVGVAEGHRAGSRALRPVVETAIDLGVESLAVYAFSTENWSRSPDEVEALMEIFGETIDRELPDLAKEGVRTRFVGRRDRAPDWLQAKMADLENATAGETRLNLWIAFDYGGRAELVDAARRIAERGLDRRGVVRPVSLCAGDARPRPRHPHVGRAARLELPALAVGVRGVRLRRHTLAGLRAGGVAQRDGGIRAATPQIRRTMSNLFSRVFVGMLGLPLVLGAVWVGGWWLFALVAIAAAIAVHEFVTMARPLRPLAPAAYIGTILGLSGAQSGGVVWLLGGVMATFAFAFALNAVASTRPPATVAIGATVLGATWIGFGLGHLLLLRHEHVHAQLLAFTVLLTVWAADTFAFFGGRLFGRHKLAPSLSPGKTWEGLVIGSAAGIIVSFIALYDTRDTYLSSWQAIVLGLVVVLAAAAGDLFESMLKRDMEVKDTGRLLGGHGGVLDRIDALLFAGIAAYYVVLGFGYS